jgi:NADH-quinone oxidoreductase subunit N
MSLEAYNAVRQTLLVLLPEFLIIAVATALMTAGAFVRRPRRFWSITAAATWAVALVVLLVLGRATTDPYAAVALNDPLAFYARLVFLVTSLILLGLAHDQVDDARAAEFFGGLLMITAGSMLVAAANEIVFLFVGLELVSIPIYLLLYLPRRSETTQEAATKYFFLSIFSSALLLFGLAYLYGLCGVSNLRTLAFLARVVPNVVQPQFGVIAVLFIVAGLGFRVAAVPFHFYAPDVYQGSPTVLAALLAWIPKGVGFLGLLRVLTCVLGGEDLVAGKGVVLCWVLAAITMTLGNAVALLQDNLRRLLAYSSIAHAGYILVGVTVAFRNPPGTGAGYLGSEGVLLYLAVYALMTLGAFGVIIALSTPEHPVETVDDLAGLGWSRPWPALAMALCLFSLAGVPPLAGFWGKFEIFASAFTVTADEEALKFQILAVIGVLNAAVGAYYYLRIIVIMYLGAKPATPLSRSAIPWPTAWAVGICAVLSLVFGMFPQPLVRAAREAALAAIATPEPRPEIPPRAAENAKGRAIR